MLQLKTGIKEQNKTFVIMDYEKKYKEALELARVAAFNGHQSLMEGIFHELKESEEERIREYLIQWINEFPDTIWKGHYKKDIIAWLEKARLAKPVISDDALREGISHFGITQYQIDNWLKKYIDIEKQDGQNDSDVKDYNSIDPHFGKSIDKVEPKFKVGDWVVHDMSDGKKIIRQIINMTNKSYVLDGEGFNTFYFKNLENEYHLWTIQDAKNGDVLCGYPEADYPWIGIFCKLNADYTFNSYCYLQAGLHGKFCPPSGENIFGEKNVDNHSLKNIVPATKEQRELLFSKMKEAGYEWSDKDRKLIKIVK